MPSRRRASVVVVTKGKLLCVRLADPLTNQVATYVPGGKIEANETAGAAAERECLEETGYEVSIEESSEVVARYPFVFGGVSFDCTTHFFRGTITDPDQIPARVNDADYHRGVLWIPLCEIEPHFNFHTDIMRWVLHLATTSSAT